MAEWSLVVAAGPSLRRSDVELFRGRCRAIAINCAVFFVPWASHLFAADAVWWRYYVPKIDWYKGVRVSRTYHAAGVQQWRGQNWKRTGGNSGHMGVQYTVDLGAKNIALLGFDQQRTEGKSHFHADHPKLAEGGKRTNMANANGIAAWPRLMARTAEDLKMRGVDVINLSRETALTCFRRMTVESFLEDVCP